MSRTLDQLVLEDFTGGLNLSESQSKLRPNESPAMLNIDVTPRVGFQTRKGWRRWSAADIDTPSTWEPRNAYTHAKSTGGFQVFITSNDTIYVGDSSAFTNLNIECTATPHLADVVAWGDDAYIVTGQGSTAPSYKYEDGGNLLNMLAPTDENNSLWNPNYDTPVGGVMPKADYAVAHSGYIFVAHTFESETHPNRVRWSHPSRPEDWAYLDYIDIETGGGRITALLSFQDHLLIFKTDSLWALYGYSSESWQLVKVSSSIGAPSPAAVTRSETAAYFYSASEASGVYAYNGGQPLLLSERISYDVGRVTRPNNAFVGWVNKQLWVSLPVGPTSAPSSVYVFDPLVGTDGAWMSHRCAVGSLTCIIERSDIETNEALACVSGDSGVAAVVALDSLDVAADELTDGVFTPFDSYYRTSWQWAGYPDRRKSWRRYRLKVVAVAQNVDISFGAYYDYEVNSEARRGVVPVEARGTLYWRLLGASDPAGDGFDWADRDNPLPTDALWGNRPSGTLLTRTQSDSLPGLGRSRALQLLFGTTGDSVGRAWGIEGLILKYNMLEFTT